MPMDSRIPTRRWGLTVGAAVCIAIAAFVLTRLPADRGSGGDPSTLRSTPGARLVTLPAAATVSKRTVIEGMTLHHSESGTTAGGKRVDAALIGSWHEARRINGGFRGAAASAYHFVILPDGTVQAGRPLNVAGSGTRNLADNRRSIGVVLVGNFSSRANRGRDVPAEPTDAQLRSLTRLALWAFSTFGFGPEQVHGHREESTSDCPGDRVDLDALRARLAEAGDSGEQGAVPPIVLVR